MKDKMVMQTISEVGCGSFVCDACRRKITNAELQLLKQGKLLVCPQCRKNLKDYYGIIDKAVYYYPFTLNVRNRRKK